MVPYEIGARRARAKYAGSLPTAAWLTAGGGTGAAAGALIARRKDDDGEPASAGRTLAGAGIGAGTGLAAGALGAFATDTPVDWKNNPERRQMAPTAYSELETRFEGLKKQLKRDGVYTGTAHKRIAIPKAALSEQQIRALGFQPVTIAIPETGQNEFRSWRHPTDNHHIHSHPDHWTMHLDGHAAAPMIAMRSKNPAKRLKALAQGAPHLITEGLPGLGIYLRGQLPRLYGKPPPSMVARIFEEQAAKGLRMARVA